MELSIGDLNSQQVRSEIGHNLRRLRLEKQLSQQQLARRSGVQQFMVSRVESGSRWLDLPLLIMLAYGLGEPVAALMPHWVERLLGVPLEALRGAAGRPRA